MSKDEQVSVRMEFGLVLPNGSVAWNEYRGHPVQTPEQRWILVEVLRKTAEEIGFDEKDFLELYCWQSRAVTTTIKNTKTWDIDNGEVCSAPSELASVDGSTPAD